MGHMIDGMISTVGRWRCTLPVAIFAVFVTGVPFCVSRALGAGATATNVSNGNLVEINASFLSHARYSIYQRGERVEVDVSVRRPESALADNLVWTIKDYRGQTVQQKQLPVPVGGEWHQRVSLPSDRPGYFELHLRLDRSGATIPCAGSHPAGYVSYGILPDIQTLHLAHADEFRFGIQGTSFVASGQFMVGDPYFPLYQLLGVRWVNLPRSMFQLEPDHAGQFEPKLTAEEIEKANTAHYETKDGLSLLVTIHGLPQWNVDLPKSVTENPKFKFSGGTTGQAYAPKSDTAFKSFLGRVAEEQVALRKTRFNDMAHSYYQVQWEPDWHWKGTDDALIRLYKDVYEAIKPVDPQSIIMGLGSGVTAKGNEMLERLFKEGLGQYLDGITTHGYYLPLGNPFSTGPEGRLRSPEEGKMAQNLRKTRQLADRYLKPGAKVFQTEWGVDYRGKYSALTPELLRLHGAYDVRGHITALGEGCDVTFLFYLADYEGESGYGMCFNLTMPHPNFGATHVSPKPAFMAAATMTRLLEGTKTVGPLNLGKDVSAYVFDRAGHRLVAVWSNDDKNREVQVPVSAGRVTLFDAMGEGQERSVTGRSIPLEVGMYPTYILSGDTPSMTTQE